MIRFLLVLLSFSLAAAHANTQYDCIVQSFIDHEDTQNQVRNLKVTVGQGGTSAVLPLSGKKVTLGIGTIKEGNKLSSSLKYKANLLISENKDVINTKDIFAYGEIALSELGKSFAFGSNPYIFRDYRNDVHTVYAVLCEKH